MAQDTASEKARKRIGKTKSNQKSSRTSGKKSGSKKPGMHGCPPGQYMKSKGGKCVKYAKTIPTTAVDIEGDVY